MYPRWNHECYQIDYGIKMNINNNKLASVMAFDFGVPYASDIDGEKRNVKKMNKVMQNKIALLLLAILLSQNMDTIYSHRNSGKI